MSRFRTRLRSWLESKLTAKPDRISSACMKRRPYIEKLEGRRVFASLAATNTAVIDFDGATFGSQEFQIVEPNWELDDFKTDYYGEAHFPSFHSVFRADRPRLDINGDGLTNRVDADLAIDMIVELVRQDFAPYDLNIVQGGVESHSHVFRDGILGDVMVIVSGGYDNTNFRPEKSAGGWAKLDPGNQVDGLGLAFANQKPEYMTAEQLISITAGTISHEMAHSFGLDHVVQDYFLDIEPITHSLMMTGDLDGDGRIDRDLNHDRGFHDRYYETESGALQNSHVILSRDSVLGPSSNPWMAVLTPGTLTVSGGVKDDLLRVESADDETWKVTMNTEVAMVNVEAPDDHFDRNPFEQPISRVEMYGGDGDDMIGVDASMNVPLTAFGGEGDDWIFGGAAGDILSGGQGVDHVYGFDGNDVLSGDAGHDRLYGGNDRDQLFGGDGDDWLYGEGGFDILAGEDGNDFLDGGQDRIFDRLIGGQGADRFRSERYFDFSTRKYRNRDAASDFQWFIDRYQ